MKRLILSLSILHASTLARATEEVTPDLASSFVQMIFGLGAVIAVLLASLWLIKRLSAPRGASAGMQVVGAVAVGTREKVVLVEIADKVLVLGVTSASINTLHTLDKSELPDPSEAATTPRADFSGWLRQSLERRKHER